MTLMLDQLISRISALEVQCGHLLNRVTVLETEVQARPDAHTPLDNCPNNAAVSRHDLEIKALQHKSEEQK